MTRISSLLMLSIALCGAANAGTPPASGAATGAAAGAARAAPAGGAASSPSETTLQKVLRVVGISVMPAQRGEAGAGSGSVWVGEVAGGAPVRWSVGGGLRSPVFDAQGQAVYAMSGEALLRIAGPGESPTPVTRVAGVAKLIGFDADDPEALLVLTTDRAAPLALLNLTSGRLTSLPVDPMNTDQQRIVALVRGQTRVAGSLSVSVQNQSRQALARTVEWTDVMVRNAGQPVRNLSECAGTDCSQPALSPDLRRVAFVRAE